MTMRYDWIDEYLMGKRAVTKDLQAEWNWIRYKIGDRMFAAILLDDDDNKPVYINLKLEPAEGEFLRAQYADIIPGYYSDKRCWNSVMPDGEVPDELLRGLLDKSYSLVLKGFPKKRQREILGLSACGADCSTCYCKDLCAGCNEACGKVFHMRDGATCPVYACCVGRHRFATCGDCPEAPCGLWRSERDPSYSDEQFENSIRERLRNLKG